jgi:phosphatidylinositol glycan class M
MQHTYLYHITREDHRHNFSIWFYQLYLGMESTSKLTALLAFVPQFALIVIIGITLGKDIFFATFVQTFIFVSFNKVITSQVNKKKLVVIFLLIYLIVFHVVYLLVSFNTTFIDNQV